MRQGLPNASALSPSTCKTNENRQPSSSHWAAIGAHQTCNPSSFRPDRSMPIETSLVTSGYCQAHLYDHPGHHPNTPTFRSHSRAPVQTLELVSESLLRCAGAKGLTFVPETTSRVVVVVDIIHLRTLDTMLVVWLNPDYRIAWGYSSGHQESGWGYSERA